MGKKPKSPARWIVGMRGWHADIGTDTMGNIMEEEIVSMVNHFARSIRFLLCDPAGNDGDLPSLDEERIHSPIRCFDKAVDEKPEIIVIHFARMPIREREALVELGSALKRNSHTRDCFVLALLFSKHRELIEDLARAKVDYIRHIGDAVLDSFQVRKIIEGLGPDDRAERYLGLVCPFLNYCPIDSQNEMTVCGAYLDRMALGGCRLHEICETVEHLRCEYYLNPRPKK